MTKILLLEDDPILGKGLAINLGLAGFEVSWERTLQAARKRNSDEEFNLVILDVGLPDGCGFNFCRELRDAGSRLPILMLTARDDEESVVEGLQMGASDYIRKPFGNKELLARIRTALREPMRRENQLRYASVLVLLDQRKVLIDNQELELNRREFDIFCYLVDHAEAVITREALLQVLDKDGEIFDRTIDSHLSHIRSKLKKVENLKIQISSVYGLGYRLEKI
jgi:two-component system OmpR family response regulator